MSYTHLPLSLYIHIPWCEKKCPYCDFNSHVVKDVIEERQYIEKLLVDLHQDISLIQDRVVSTIFIGGGTPSLFQADSFAYLLNEIKNRITVSDDCEITIEANPESVTEEKLSGYLNAGINRISIGVQSFNHQHLIQLGRIHDANKAIQAVAIAKKVGFSRINIDLMHTLPKQYVKDSLSDLKQALLCDTTHLSWYQLTIEPNTQFGSKPPVLPDEETEWSIYEAGNQLLKNEGFQAYEISAWSKNDPCRHNINYWLYNDYLGIGCGAHSKITLSDRRIIRFNKIKHPKGYLKTEKNFIYQQYDVLPSEQLFEYFMNRFRLYSPVHLTEIITRTHLDVEDILPYLEIAEKRLLLVYANNRIRLTPKGHQYLNQLLKIFIE